MTSDCEWLDNITVLHTPGRRMAKLVRADGTLVDYDDAYRYNIHSVPVTSIFDVLALLRRLIDAPECCVVRAELIPGTPTRGVRRLAFPDTETGDAATLRDKARRWLAIDVDGVARPDDVPFDDLEACADLALDALPPIFLQATCIVQATGGHGIKPGVRLRLWFWCDRPMAGEELKRWLKPWPCDRSVFNIVQPIYSAAPVFAPGRKDHLPSRLHVLHGDDWLRCPSKKDLAPPPRQPPEYVAPVHVAGSARAQLYVDGALEKARERITNAQLRHPAILSEACSLARFVHAGLLTRGALYNALWAGAQAAGKDDQAEVERMVDFGLNHPDHAAIPEDVRHG